ncbi:MAG: YHS domain-containing (seleno)protein [Chromatiales bacterium]
MGKLKAVVFVVFLACTDETAWADDAVFTADGIAIRGYDAVAYHAEQRPVPGASGYTHEWQGVIWQFASQANLDAFAAQPEAYAPQYGGYCAYAASHGALAPTDPSAWTLHNGKLYLNYSHAVREKWRQDIDEHIVRADRHWPRLKQQR